MSAPSTVKLIKEWNKKQFQDNFYANEPRKSVYIRVLKIY